MTTTLANKTPARPNKAPASSRTVRRAALAMLLGAAALAPATPSIVAASSAAPLRATALPRPRTSRGPTIPPRPFAQDDDSGDTTPDKGVSPDQVDKYVAVYRAMQRNHSVTVEQAAAAQGLTVEAFRDLERRIGSDERTRDDARRALAAPSATPATTPTARR